MKKILATAIALPLLFGAFSTQAEENVVINGLNKAQEISDKIEAQKADKEAWEAKKEQMKKRIQRKEKRTKRRI